MDMKRIKPILTIMLLMMISGVAHAQDINNDIQAINAQVQALARLFCKYVVAVGSTPGQPGAVSDAQKAAIINDKVPRLFYQYDQRYMVTTNGRNGKVVKRRQMRQYFNSLRAQSASRLNTARSYELSFVGFLPTTGGKKTVWRLKEVAADGSSIYYSTIMIDQIYHRIRWNSEGGITVTEEHDYKELEVNVLTKPSGRYQVFLGDVKRAYRVN